MGLDILLHCLQRNQRGVANRAHWSLRWNLASIVDRARQVYDQYLKELVVRVKEGIAEDTKTNFLTRKSRGSLMRMRRPHGAASPLARPMHNGLAKSEERRKHHDRGTLAPRAGFEPTT